MKKKTVIQSEIKFKSTEFQLNLLIGPQKTCNKEIQFFPSKNCQLKAKTNKSE